MFNKLKLILDLQSEVMVLKSEWQISELFDSLEIIFIFINNIGLVQLM